MHGASLLALEKIFVAANSLAAGTATSLHVVRLGEILDLENTLGQQISDLPSAASELVYTSELETMTQFCIPLNVASSFVISTLSNTSPGCILVPKMASIQLLDLVKAITPNQVSKGVRLPPGTKKHMVLIEGRNNRRIEEFPDKFVIQPDSASWGTLDNYDPSVPTMPESFKYVSEKNHHWLDLDGIQTFLKLRERQKVNPTNAKQR